MTREEIKESVSMQEILQHCGILLQTGQGSSRALSIKATGHLP